MSDKDKDLESFNSIQIPLPVIGSRFHVSYSCGGVKYDLLTRQTVSATYDFRKKELVCEIELDVEGNTELALSNICNSSAIIGYPVRPTISINRLDGMGEVLYSTMCEMKDVVSCEIETSYKGEANSVARAMLVCEVGSFDVVTPLTND